MARSFEGDKSSGFKPQKEAPRFLIILGEMDGGLEHPKQFMSLQIEDLKPLCNFLNLVLLLTSALERGAFPLACFLFLGVCRPSVLLETKKSCSSSRSSKTTEEDYSKFEQTGRVTFGHSFGKEKRVVLPDILGFIRFQALD